MSAPAPGLRPNIKLLSEPLNGSMDACAAGPPAQNAHDYSQPSTRLHLLTQTLPVKPTKPSSRGPLANMARKSLRILCFGDSLTSGYCSWGMNEHPYSGRLQEKLQQAFPHVDIDIVTNGKPGDIASFARFEERLKAECMYHQDPPCHPARPHGLSMALSPGPVS